MPLERRLRATFERAATSVEPNVGRHLEVTVDRAAGRRRERPFGALLVGTVAIVAVVIGTRLLGTATDGVGGPTPISPAPLATGSVAGSFDAIAGTYSVTLQSSDPEITQLGLAGDWSLTLHPTGAIDLVPPGTFQGSLASGHMFTLDGTAFRTDLYYNDYCTSVGTYQWGRTSERLVLTVADDDCAIRRALLGTRPWSAAG